MQSATEVDPGSLETPQCSNWKGNAHDNVHYFKAAPQIEPKNTLLYLESICKNCSHLCEISTEIVLKGVKKNNNVHE